MMQQQHQHHEQRGVQPEDGELEPDVEGNAMLEGVILPAFEHVSVFALVQWEMADGKGWISNTRC